MTRWIALMMTLCLALGVLSAGQAEESGLLYASDFTKNADGWFPRGAQSVKPTEEGALLTEGRTSDWNSPGRVFPLVPGGKYQVSVEVRQGEADSAEFILSVEHSVDATPSWENLARGKAAKDEWITLSAGYTAGEFDQFVLYVETAGAPELSYEIRNFRLSAPEGEPEAKPTEAPMVIEAAENLPSLKELYADLFDFGSAVPRQAFTLTLCTDLIREQFNILTPENELKPDAVLDVNASRKQVEQTGDETAAAVHFSAAVPLLDFARDNGLKVHGHVLVWHSQTPEAFFHEGYDTKKPLVTREVMLGRLEHYIQGVMDFMAERYPGVVVSWDVVNEAIDDGNGYLRPSNWTKVVGEDFLARAFELARRYAPEGTKLYYNDYSTDSPAKRPKIVKLLSSLIPEGNIDGYGFQMHHKVGTSMPNITRSVEEIAKLGLRLRVSELDVGAGGNTEKDFVKQADKYAEIMKLLIRYADQFEAVQVWGLTDTMSWRSSEFPLLFDGKFNPKPAFYAVAGAIEEK